MTWICPSCKRPFKHKNQAHSCVQVNVEEHFVNKDPDVYRIYQALMKALSKLSNVVVSPARNAILVTSSSTFLAIKPKRSWLDIEFLLDEGLNELPVYKVVRASKKRYAHFVRLESMTEVDKKIVSLLVRSYKLVSSS